MAYHTGHTGIHRAGILSPQQGPSPAHELSCNSPLNPEGQVEEECPVQGAQLPPDQSIPLPLATSSTWPARQTHGTVFPASRTRNQDPGSPHVLQSPGSRSQSCADTLGLITVFGYLLMLCCKYASKNPLLSLDLICKGFTGSSVLILRVNISHQNKQELTNTLKTGLSDQLISTTGPAPRSHS